MRRRDAITLGGARAASASRRATVTVACKLLAPTQIRSILALSQSTITRDYQPTGPIPGSTDTECGWGAWNGKPPSSVSATFAMVRRGRAGQVGIETWAPNDGSPNVKEWKDKEYDLLIRGFDTDGIVFPGIFSTAGWPAHHFVPAGLGYVATGLKAAVQGPGKGLVAAIGCWWHDKTYSAICVFDEEAASHPVVKHLNQIAKIAVPKFLG